MIVPLIESQRQNLPSTSCLGTRLPGRNEFATEEVKINKKNAGWSNVKNPAHENVYFMLRWRLTGTGTRSKGAQGLDEGETRSREKKPDVLGNNI